jgi:phosphotransferase system IIB component
MPSSDFFGAITAGLQAKDALAANKLARQQKLMQLEAQRQGAIYQDARTVNTLLKANLVDKALDVTRQRKGFLQQLDGDNADTQDTEEVENLILSGDVPAAIELLGGVERAGVQSGFLQSTEPDELQQLKLEQARQNLEKGAFGLERLRSGEPERDRRVAKTIEVPGGTYVVYDDGSEEFKKFGQDVIDAAREEAQRNLPKLTSSMQNKLLDIQESANTAYSLAEKSSLLSDRFSKVDATAGAAGSAREAFLNIVGGQDEISNLRKDYTRIRNKLITANLPQGPATDKDIELIAAGFPSATASQAQIVDFLQAMSRGQEAVAKFDEFKANFLQQNGNITRATRDFTFDGQGIKKGERLAPAYKRISKNLEPKAAITSNAIVGQQAQPVAQQPRQRDKKCYKKR